MLVGRPSSWILTAILFIQKNKIVKNEFIDLKNIILDGQIVLQIDHQTEILNISVWTLFWPPSWIFTTILFFHKTKNAGNEFLDLTNVYTRHKNHVSKWSTSWDITNHILDAILDAILDFRWSSSPILADFIQNESGVHFEHFLQFSACS